MHLWKFQQVMLYCFFVILWYILFILFHLWQITASNNILCSIVMELLIILPALFMCGFYISKQQLSNWEFFALRNDHYEIYDVVATSNLRCLFHEVLELLWTCHWLLKWRWLVDYLDCAIHCNYKHDWQGIIFFLCDFIHACIYCPNLVMWNLHFT